MYFNKKYERIGGLFQGRFKAVIVDRQEYFQYLPHYIQTNPLELNYRGRTSIIERGKMKFLENYRWSSFPDYIGKKNFPSVTQRDFILGVFGGEKNYRKHTETCLRQGEQEKWLGAIQDVLMD